MLPLAEKSVNGQLEAAAFEAARTLAEGNSEPQRQPNGNRLE
jgi:hypothetical protein